MKTARSTATKGESDGVIFGRQLRQLRLARGLTQQQLAALIDSNHPFISNMERGLTLPGLAMLRRLADALDCSVSSLVRVLDRRATSRRSGGNAQK
ncbi:MAG TPA: helix-turn-helix transcriptional regulator [Thermoanaerobaculia bacterium]|jgi:transcriptional regulator with XRE-family HTH domain|nr:helix-turn-helix transcriptional regulator [Thermoanaerobaculia bacterium]